MPLLVRRRIIDAVKERGWKLVPHNWVQNDLLTYYAYDPEQERAVILSLLAEALRKQKPDAAAVAARRARWKAEHDKLRQRLEAAEEKAAGESSITVPLVARLLHEAFRTQFTWTKRSCMRASSAST